MIWLLPVLVGLPIGAGLLATLFEAFGIIPGLRGESGHAWEAFLGWPGLAHAVILTLRVGVLSTAASIVTALLLCAVVGRRAGVWVAPLLAVPHAALAAGLALLVAPSGVLARLGVTMPSVTVGDQFGLLLAFGQWLKETPFLLLVALAALPRLSPRARLAASAGLGIAPLRAWLVTVVPALWPSMRLPSLAVLAYGLSSADMAIVLGPQARPTLAVLVLRWAADPDLSRWRLAGIGAALLTGLVVACAALLLGCEALLRRAAWWRAGGRGRLGLRWAALFLLPLIGAGFGGLAALLAWAGADTWFFPAVLPRHWSLGRLAARWTDLAWPVWNTLWLAVVTAVVALVATVLALRSRAQPAWPWWWLWLPLLLPQPGVVFGLQLLLVRAGLDGTATAMILAHLVFVLPYVALVLRGPWRALDPRYAATAASLGLSPLRTLWRVILPLLAAPLAASAAVAVAVSASLYVPTVFAGAGRFPTLATETVALSSGDDRRVLAATALAQAALPLVAFGASLAVTRR